MSHKPVKKWVRRKVDKDGDFSFKELVYNIKGAEGCTVKVTPAESYDISHAVIVRWKKKNILVKPKGFVAWGET